MSNFKPTSPKMPDRSPSISHQSSHSSLHPPVSHNNNIHHSHHSHGGSNGGSIPIPNASSSRKPSIVELLSSPPPLPQQTNNNDDINSFNLSRNNSISSRSLSTINDLFEIQLTELIEKNKLISIDESYSIQKAFEILKNNNLTSVPVNTTHSNDSNIINCLTFDYSDLNTYLLLIMNKISLNDLNSDFEGFSKESFNNLVSKAKKGEEVPVDFIIKLHPKNPFIKINEFENLLTVMEILGNGVHRIAITNNFNEIIGILSQRRLIKYIWDNARRFNNLEYYFNQTIEDLKIGSTNPITIYEDQYLIDALYKMFNERISSLAVIDRKGFLIGNISIVDVQNITSSQNSHLLFKSVLNFISYNLSQKGIEEGKDQFPIFHVNKLNGLGRIIAKLVATQSHRLWIVETNQSIQQSNSGSISSSSSGNNNNTHGSSTPTPSSTPAPPTPINTNTNANTILNMIEDFSNSEYSKPGKLIGVITLTDIIGFLASIKSNGKIDPQFARNQRRRSSTSTRSSMDNQEFRK